MGDVRSRVWGISELDHIRRAAMIEKIFWMLFWMLIVISNKAGLSFRAQVKSRL